MQDRGGYLCLEDLRYHEEQGSEEVEPISINYKTSGVSGNRKPEHARASGVDVWECPPNGQGLVALMALGILQELEKGNKIRHFEVKDHNSTE